MTIQTPTPKPIMNMDTNDDTNTDIDGDADADTNSDTKATPEDTGCSHDFSPFVLYQPSQR